MAATSKVTLTRLSQCRVNHDKFKLGREDKEMFTAVTFRSLYVRLCYESIIGIDIFRLYLS